MDDGSSVGDKDKGFWLIWSRLGGTFARRRSSCSTGHSICRKVEFLVEACVGILVDREVGLFMGLAEGMEFGPEIVNWMIGGYVGARSGAFFGIIRLEPNGAAMRSENLVGAPVSMRQTNS